jgi:hypothetical protein
MKTEFHSEKSKRLLGRLVVMVTQQCDVLIATELYTYMVKMINFTNVLLQWKMIAYKVKLFKVKFKNYLKPTF